MESLHEFQRKRIKMALEERKTRYDCRTTDQHFKEGDQVWMQNPKRWRGLSPKLQQNWDRPYAIVKKLDHVLFTVHHHAGATHHISM
ncbi:hypothetical protein AVEN_86049-1 [Araneus ventricosus]|uniref:Integrase zinc-binding domain-containing protein n=1 Tax=Araneus ventricosus TaxID=182803 RepID=A0A4Y2MHC3_ARAVE|nr:hypothetical protein AVEN_86049-1 [Araneus ventricosus]